MKSCRSPAFSRGLDSDSFFHLPAVSIIKQQCPLNRLTRLFSGVCISFPRVHDCLHAICTGIRYIKRQENMTLSESWETLGMTNPRLDYYQEMKYWLSCLHSKDEQSLIFLTTGAKPEPPGAAPLWLGLTPFTFEGLDFCIIRRICPYIVYPGVLARPSPPPSLTLSVQNRKNDLLYCV